MKTLLSILLLISCLQLSLAQSTNYGDFAGTESVGNNNTNFGYATGYKNIGNDNTSIGTSAGSFNNGHNNTFTGSKAGYSNKGSFNSFFGRSAGSSNTGSFSSFFGFNAGLLNTGDNTIFLGYSAGLKNTGVNNIAIGSYSGGAGYNTDSDMSDLGMSGGDNVFIGAFSGQHNSTGLHNTYIGSETGRHNSRGAYNTYIGMRAGTNSSGSNNVFIGYNAGYFTSTSHKLIIANSVSSSIPLITGDFRSKHVSIGGIGDPKFTLHVLGTAHTTSTFTSSDVRFKKNIKKIEKASEKLLAIDGVSYEFKPDSTRNFHQGKTYGFIAQDVQKVLPAVVAADHEGYLALNYECFIPLLVEAFKEMRVEYQQLADANELLQKEVDLLKKLLSRRKPLHSAFQPHAKINAFSNTDDLFLEEVVLHQNAPNPFNQTTIITYEVNKEAKQIALYVYDLTGKPILEFTNLPAEKSELTIEAEQLTPGLYLYSLLVDGKIADTKRMILTN